MVEADLSLNEEHFKSIQAARRGLAKLPPAAQQLADTLDSAPFYCEMASLPTEKSEDPAASQAVVAMVLFTAISLHI